MVESEGVGRHVRLGSGSLVLDGSHGKGGEAMRAGSPIGNCANGPKVCDDAGKFDR